MNILKAYIGGFQKAIKLPRMLFISYFANLFTALILALTFNGVLKESFGQSGILSSLLEDFNYSAFSNLMSNHGDAIWAVLGGIKWLIIAYFLMSIFLTGGIVQTFSKDKFSTSSFFGGAAYNFFSFLGLSLIMIVVQVVFFLAIYIPLSLILKSVSESMTSEVSLYYYAIGGFSLHLLIFLLISMIGDYAKFYLVLNDSFNVFKGFWNGAKYVFKNFLKTYLLYLILLVIPAAIAYLYLYLERDIKMATGIGILIVFGMQQAFMLLRVFLRVWVLSSQFKIYNDTFVQPITEQAIVFSVVDTKTNTEKVLVEEPVKKSSKDPVKEQPVVVKEEVKTEYAIDFSKTFTSVDEDDHTGEKIITEAEMLKKVSEQEGNQSEDNLITSNDEQNVDIKKDPTIKIEKVEQNVVNVKDSDQIDENLITSTSEQDIDTKVDPNVKIEKVEQNVVNVKDSDQIDENLITSTSEQDIDTKVDPNVKVEKVEQNVINANESEQVNENLITSTSEQDIDSKEDPTLKIEKVEQNVITAEDESGVGVEIDKNKEKKTKDDIIEFEL